jgi:hypothetical protein
MFGICAMARFVYFDTDAFQHIGRAFAKGCLPVELRERIVLSPITILEIFSQLTLAGPAGEEILSAIRAMLNYADPNNLRLLPWWPTAIKELVFHEAAQDDDLQERIEEVLNRCLSAKSPEEYESDVGELKDMLDRERERQKKRFLKLVQAYKNCPEAAAKFQVVCVDAIVQGVTVSASSAPRVDIPGALSAHIEHQEERVKLAANDPNHKPKENDYFDSLQLLYLANPELHFCTCDKGYARRIKRSPQLTRIHTTAVENLADPGRAGGLLAGIVS